MNNPAKNPGSLYQRIGPAAAAGDPSRAGGVEGQILKFSLYSALFFAVLGLVWGALLRSQMLIFDGVYALVSVVSTGLSVYVSKVMGNEDDPRFPFGRAQMEPLAVILKSAAILVVCAFAFSRAAGTLLSGGREVSALSAMAYFGVGIVGCLGSWIYIARRRGQSRLSGLTRVEGRQWLADTLLSAVAFLGFLLAHLARGTEHAYFARNADSLMVMAAALFFAAVPVVSLAGGIRDMLLMAPGGSVYRVSRQALGEIAKRRGFDGLVLRIGKAGSKLFYEIGFVSRVPGDARSIGELDSIRREVEETLQGLCDNPLGLGVSFMHDEKWG